MACEHPSPNLDSLCGKCVDEDRSKLYAARGLILEWAELVEALAGNGCEIVDLQGDIPDCPNSLAKEERDWCSPCLAVKSLEEYHRS